MQRVYFMQSNTRTVAHSKTNRKIKKGNYCFLWFCIIEHNSIDEKNSERSDLCNLSSFA